MNVSRVSKVVVFVLGTIPLVYLGIRVAGNTLGPDPAKTLALLTGEWAMCGVLLTLSISPLARYYAPARMLIGCRRIAGLWTFFYATLHLLVFVALYLGFDGAVLLDELGKRPYITVGFLAWIILFFLAITSNDYSVRRLGRRWKILHRLVYPALLLAICHVIWQVRSDWSDAFVFGVAGAVLLGERIISRLSTA